MKLDKTIIATLAGIGILLMVFLAMRVNVLEGNLKDQQVQIEQLKEDKNHWAIQVQDVISKNKNQDIILNKLNQDYQMRYPETFQGSSGG